MILFLKPHFEFKPWAGDDLKKIYDCPDSCGEAWIVSGYKNKSSIIKNGKFKNKTLRWLWNSYPSLFGDYNEKEFPLLLKLISSKENLSVQVHPNDDYALKKHNSLGKFECWYVLPETKATSVTLGVNVKNSIELKSVLDNGLINQFLINVPIEKDDLIIVEPGRVHAIHGDAFFLETQESSDITYRIYDFNRMPKRPLHIDDALNVIDYNNEKNFVHNFKANDTFKNSHFNLYKLHINGEEVYENKGFEIFYILEGSGSVNNNKIKKGDTFILTNEQSKLVFTGEMKLIAVKPKPKDKERMKMRKIALITGIVGENGYYLTKLLLEKNYEVHGMIQSASQFLNSSLIEFKNNKFFFTHIGDMTDTSNINRLLENIKPDEIYHLACQSHIDYSFEIPEYTAQVNALGTLRLLDAIKSSEIRTKLFNLSSCYLFSGDVYPQTEQTPFNPKSPYAVSKLFAFYSVKNYRENYNIFAVNGICYNQVSPVKESSSVCKKIVEYVKKFDENNFVALELGNLNARREWGHTEDYVCAMWHTLQLDVSDDYIISSGTSFTVREFVEIAFRRINLQLTWEGTGLDEKGVDQYGRVIVRINPDLIRPADGDVLVGNPQKLENKTKFKFKYDLQKLLDSLME